MNLAAQVTSMSDSDYDYSGSHFEQRLPPKDENSRTGFVVWADKIKPGIDIHLFEVVKKCLAN